MQDALSIPQTWINLNTLSGHAVGESLTLQNVSQPGDLFSLYIGRTKPDDSLRGVALDQIKNIATIITPAYPVWARYYRIDGAIPYPAKTGLLQVQAKDTGITIGNTENSSSLIDYTDILSIMVESLANNTKELRLLNARFEEAFETKIHKQDIN